MERLKIAASTGVQLWSNEPREGWLCVPLVALWEQPSTCWGQEPWCPSAQFVTIPTAGAQLSCKTSIPQATHRSGHSKKHPLTSFATGMTPTAPSAGNTDLDLPLWLSLVPGKGRFTATELNQQLAEAKSNFQGSGLAKHPQPVFQGVTKTKGQASPKTLPLSSLGDYSRKNVRLLCQGARDLRNGERKNRLKIEKVIVLWLKCHLTPKSTTWK